MDDCKPFPIEDGICKYVPLRVWFFPKGLSEQILVMILEGSKMFTMERFRPN
jgi:hypothetical protein